MKMAYSYNVDEVPPAELPCLPYEIRKAKEYLQKHSPESGDSLYDHLSELLNKILAERPRNAVDVFEDYSKKLKEERFKNQTDHLRDLYIPPVQYENAKKLIKLFEVSQTQEVNEGTEYIQEREEEGDLRKEKPNLLDLLFYIEQADVGLPRSEILILNLSFQKLISEVPIENVRFWGKILGNPKNYYVMEADLQTEELNRRQEQILANDEKQKEKEAADADEAIKISEEEAAASTQKEATEKEALDAVLITELPGEGKPTEKGLELIFPPLPQNLWKPPVEIPPEPIGTGLNKKIYFVCNSPGLDNWIELPLVTPQQIIASRDIVRMFTGNLETELFTFPPFPGNEANYLRAQIARISAATLISPMGYFTLGGGGDEEEEIGEEEERNDGDISENPHYDSLPVKELIDPSMSNWCHHSPYILKQGRVVFWSPEKTDFEAEDEEVDEEEEEEEEEVEKEMPTIEKEVGPPLLTPLSEDATLDSIVPWTTRQSSRVQTDTSIALVRSNVWPGAFAFASGRRFANLYIGSGNKFYAYNYSPPSMPQVQDEYKIGPEVMEIRDPSFEDEEAYRIAHLPPPPKEILGEDDEQVGEIEEDEEDDDDDEDDD